MAAVIEFLQFANRAAKIKVATWAFTSGAKSMFANRAVKFQAIAPCLKPGARRKGAAFKQNTRRGKIYRRSRRANLAKFRPN